MPKNLKVLLLVCAVWVIAHASTALGGEWFVNGTKLVGTAPLLGTATALSAALFLGGGLAFECDGTTVAINGGALAAPDTILANSITLEECTPQNIPGCSFKNRRITSFPVQGLAVLDGALNTFIELLPKTKTVLFLVPFEGGEECPIKETIGLTGGIDLLLHNGIHAQVTHQTLISTLKGQLRIASSEMQLQGSTFDPRLLSGQTWALL